MAKLSAFRKIKDITLEIGDESLNMKCTPDDFTGARLEQLHLESSGETDVEQHRFICSFLADLIQEWDLTDDEGVTIPISAEAIFSALPITLTVTILSGIQDQLMVGPQKPES